MKRQIKNITKISSIAIALLSVSTSSAFAQQYYASAPKPPRVTTVGDTWYIVSNTKGVEFYGVAPFYSQQTADRNLYVSSIVLMQDHQQAMGSYIQVDCGRFMYRDLVPWFEIDRYGNEGFSNPTTYNWQYFTKNSAFATVGKSLCEKAASDRGLQLTWFRY